MANLPQHLQNLSVKEKQRLLEILLTELQASSMRAHPRQQDFLNLECEEALYGGAAGGGKTEALLMWLAQPIKYPRYSGLFLRRTFQQLSRSNDSPIARSALIYKPLGGTYSAGEHRWTFPSGAVIEFGHMQHETSYLEYQGPSYHRVAFDEVTQFMEMQYVFMFSRRRKDPNFPYSMGQRASANPGGIGHEWVRKRFVSEAAQRFVKALTYRQPSPLGTVFWLNDDRCFVPARVADNPSIDVEDYLKRMLGHLPPKLREQMAAGDWDAVEGALIDVDAITRYGVEDGMLCALGPDGRALFSRDESSCRLFATIDTAGSSREKSKAGQAKPRSSSVIAVWRYDRKTDTLFLRHVWRDQVEWKELCAATNRTLTQWGVKRTKVENAHVGPSLVSEFKGKFGMRLASTKLAEMVVSDRGAKYERAVASDLFDRINAGNFRLPDPDRVPGVHQWLLPYERELTAWTGDPEEPADQIDVSAYACDECKTGKRRWGGAVSTRKSYIRGA